MKTKTSLQRRSLLRLAVVGFTSVIAAGALQAQSTTPASVTSVTVPNGTLNHSGFLYRPAGDGPFPAVVVLHGSGGFWSNDNPSNGMLKHLKEWGTLLQSQGYVALFVDSYRPRGILANYGNRRPCFDAAWDNGPCSPAYERPKDAYAALAWLKTQTTAPVIADRIGLMGFSQGGETALASVVASSVSRTWKVSYVTAWKLDKDGKVVLDDDDVPVPGTYNHNYSVPAPKRPATGTTGFACVVAFYPGCGFHGYFGSTSLSNTVVADCYLPSVPTLVIHGTADSLWSGGQPALLSAKADAEAAAHNVSNPMVRIEYTGAKHSFDMVTLAPQADWDTDAESDDQYAKRMGRTDALNHLDATLKAP